jgi:hypothetical protein
MNINKLVALAGVAMAFSAGTAQALTTSANAVITAQVAGIQGACTVTSGPINVGAVTIGTASKTVFSPVATCTLNTPYSYTFSSLNGGINGQLKSGTTCILSYNVVTYDPYTLAYGSVNNMVTATALLAGTGAGQVTNFAVVVSAAQGGCTLVPNAAALTVTDTLVVSVNY